MRRLLLSPALLLLAGCEPSAAKETPVNLTPGIYMFDVPLFFQGGHGVLQQGHCVKGGAELTLPDRLMKLPFEAMRDCVVDGPKRKGNYLTVEGRCNAPAYLAGSRVSIEGNAIVTAEEVSGAFKLDTSKLDTTTMDARVAAIIEKLNRFSIKARRIDDC